MLLLVALCTVYSIHLLAPARVLTHGRDAPCARRTGSKGLITKHKGTRVSLKWACPIEMHFVKASLESLSESDDHRIHHDKINSRMWPKLEVGFGLASSLMETGYQVAASGGEPSEA